MISVCLQQDTGAQRLTALMYAALTGNRESVDMLLRLGADPDILDSRGGFSCIHPAVVREL